MPKYNSINPKPLPSVDYLRACFDYSPETGELRWKVRPPEHFINPRGCKRWNSRYAGTLAGKHLWGDGGRVGIDKTHYITHRIIWKWMTEEEPPLMLDHRDRNVSNNRWNNLRPATYVEQNRNRQRPVKSISPYRGVYRSSKNRWRARIRINRAMHNLGSFPTAEEAAAVYETAARVLHGSFYVRST